MRFYRKKELISYLQEMKCKQQKLLVLQEKYQEILYDLQECAIIIGEEVETEETTHSKTIVKKLEDYCEMIYQISLLEGQAILQKHVDKLDCIISQIIQKMREMSTDKIRIAFFPYKASMWDCMDSVWKCAIKDERCVVEVIPIPFFERNNGKNEAVECYEGDLFPQYVKVRHYSTYNLSQEHPDIAYIHNPYDQCNRVTMVHPYFFSKEIKKNCDKLIYIPYYIAGIYTSEQKVCEMTELPGFYNSSYVIVQTEEYKKILKNNGREADKCIVAGSPKFDAVLTNKETLKLDYYADTLKDKKIFLLNTSISGFLKNKNWFTIMDEIVESFNKDAQSFLIWRPHPLLEATVNALRIAEREQYAKIKIKIQNMENAIIDYSANPLKAIKTADALISDYSSLVPQYYVTEKPILCLNGKKEYREKYICIFDHYDCYFYNDGLSIENFIKMVQESNDPAKQVRRLYIKKMQFKKNAGKIVHESVMRKLKED